MDLIYLLGVLMLLFSVACLALVLVGDCDIVTLLYSKHGKQPADEFRGKVVWITGASSGIGEAIAKELAKIGARLVLSARRSVELERVKQECLKNSQLKEDDILVLPLDVTNFESHEPSLKRVLSHFGKLDVLLSNAGQPQMAEFTEMDLTVDRHIFEVNVFAVVNMNRIVVKYFLKNGGGHVAVVSSIAGKSGAPFNSAYAASKHAIHGYFNTLRMETYGKKIDVTIICPGPVATPIFGKGVTNEPGKLANLGMPDNLPIMPVERCAHLSLVAMANRLNESWISKLPVIPLTYMMMYFPNVMELFFKVIGKTMVNQMKAKLPKSN
jgi:dehydrogenase/reductase SDR family protein 7